MEFPADRKSLLNPMNFTRDLNVHETVTDCSRCLYEILLCLLLGPSPILLARNSFVVKNPSSPPKSARFYRNCSPASSAANGPADNIFQTVTIKIFLGHSATEILQ